MKKFYSTLTAVALGVATMAAAGNAPKVAANLISWDGQKISETAPKQLRSDLKAMRATRHFNAPAKAEEEATELYGSYVNIYMPIFTNYYEQEMTCVVEIEDDGDGDVLLPGFANWTPGDYNSNVTVYSAVKGHLEGNTLSVESGQLLGKYSGYDLVLFMMDDDWNLYEGTEELTFVNGAFEGEMNWLVGMVQGEEVAAAFTGCGAPLLVPATHNVSYTGVQSGSEFETVAYSEMYEADGYTALVLSNIGLYSDGYLIELPVEELINEAGEVVGLCASSSEVCGYSNETDTDKEAYCYIMGSENYYAGSHLITVDCTDFDHMTMPYKDLYSFPLDDGSKEAINCWFFLDPETSYGYGPFTTAEFEAINPGAGSVAAPAVDANAPVAYYNLQGVRVQNPANGIYVRVQGNKATKVLVK